MKFECKFHSNASLTDYFQKNPVRVQCNLDMNVMRNDCKLNDTLMHIQLVHVHTCTPAHLHAMQTCKPAHVPTFNNCGSEEDLGVSTVEVADVVTIVVLARKRSLPYAFAFWPLHTSSCSVFAYETAPLHLFA